jgi:hypothetical protein
MIYYVRFFLSHFPIYLSGRGLLGVGELGSLLIRLAEHKMGAKTTHVGAILLVGVRCELASDLLANLDELLGVGVLLTLGL